jgi:hypothetical protein
MTGTVARCTKCGSQTYVQPLHGERGGPPYCPICAGAWHAEHGRRRRAARILIKAMKAYDRAGGSLYDKDFDALKIAAGPAMFAALLSASPYKTIGADDDFSDLTTELLTATLALTHPDKHPPEFQAEANRVTQELLALRPFVFPAPEPEKPLPREANDVLPKDAQPSERPYPCIDCANALPVDYCTECRERYDRERDEDCASKAHREKPAAARGI